MRATFTGQVLGLVHGKGRRVATEERQCCVHSAGAACMAAYSGLCPAHGPELHASLAGYCSHRMPCTSSSSHDSGTLQLNPFAVTGSC